MNHIRTLLLLALPASGKSELRKYIDTLSPSDREELHLGRNIVHLDDYPYVELMREIDRIMTDVFHYGPIFFQGPEERFQDPRSWLALIHLLNQDYVSLENPEGVVTHSLGHAMIERLIEALRLAGVQSDLLRLPFDVQCLLAQHIESRAKSIYRRVFSQKLTDDATLVVEFARGGPHNAAMPFPEPVGYATSLEHLSKDLLANAGVLYLYVTPEQARAKNFARAVPPPGLEHDTTTYHGVPLCVMLEDYGCDDLLWLADANPKMGPEQLKLSVTHINVPNKGTHIRIPTAIFDNREDLTTHLRENPSKWNPADVGRVRAELQQAMDQLQRFLNG